MKIENKRVNVGIGFVTGRKNFKNVVRAYLNNWNEAGQMNQKKYAFHLFVAYDLKYTGTNISDYKIIEEEILGTVDSTHYIGNIQIANEARELAEKKVAGAKAVKLIFGEGYAMKRNAVLYFALKYKMDYLIFLDDDEYPSVNIKVDNSILWKGQDVLATHLQNIPFADITHGYHCGYISPIPHFNFNEIFSQEDFKMFIETISNDIITWDSIKKKMDDQGVTYADLNIINSKDVRTVKEVGGMKFISGANLGFNLKDSAKLFPFYNPPGARGEDTFLSTCIGECNIRKVPCYTFHDGFSSYQKLLSGMLPNQLKRMDVSTGVIYKRFLKAAIGWVRYKPLLLFITHRESYDTQIEEIKHNLNIVIPKLCAYFKNDDFKVLLKELDFYDEHVQQHFQDFENTKDVWLKIVAYLTKDSKLIITK